VIRRGDCDKANFGYDTGEPCIAISIGKVISYILYLMLGTFKNAFCIISGIFKFNIKKISQRVLLNCGKIFNACLIFTVARRMEALSTFITDTT